jgi:hypothetical protein
MPNKKVYHSALKGFEEYREHSCNYFEHDGFYGICNDLESKEPYPKEVHKAQFIYCELPYPRGYDIFNERVGKSEGIGWKAMVQNARKMAMDLNIPYYFMGGKAFAPLFPIEYQIPMKFKVHNTNDIIFSNTDSWADNNEELIDTLYKHYDIGLDMACGYGELGRFALKHGKKAILMDINPYCIGYIERELLKVSYNG